MKKTIWIAAMMAGVVIAQDSRAIEEQRKLEDLKKLEAGHVRIELDNAKLIDGGKTIEAQKVFFLGQSLEFVTGMMQGPIVKNAPYAAEAVTETTQKLFDGNQIVRKTTAKQYRDSEGRERREESMGAVLITDPVDKVRITLRPETKTAEKQAYKAPQLAIYTSDGKGRAISVNKPVEWHVAEPWIATAGHVGGGEPKEENLGTKIIEGLHAQGTRNTRIIPAGDVGNLRPIEVVDERWYSPDLQITVMTRHSDPREGETVFRLNNIQRIEQVRSLFEVPSDFTVPAPGVTLKTKAKSK